MITLDTSALVALVTDRDPYHARAVGALGADPGPYVVPAGILGEAGYVIPTRVSEAALDRVLQSLEDSTLSLDCGERDIGRIRELMERYADLPLGFADSAVIACAERNGGRVLAFDCDFAVVAREGSITVLPESEG